MAGAIPVQTQEDIVPPPPKPVGFRLSGILLAPAVAATIVLIMRGPFGVNLEIPAGGGSSALTSLDLLTTTIVTLLISLVAYVSILLLQRGLGAERGRSIWMTVAFAVLAVSILPIAFLDISRAAKWGLVVLHSAVAVVLIPTMAARGDADPGIPRVHG